MANYFNLCEIPSSCFTQGWGISKPNRSICGNVLSVGGVKYANGYGTHTPACVTLELGGNGVEISGGVGIDDETGNAGEGTLVLTNLDKKQEILRVPFVHGKKAVPFRADLRGIKKLRLECLPGSEGQHMGHVDLVDVKISYGKHSPLDSMLDSVITKNLRWNFAVDKQRKVVTSLSLDMQGSNALNTIVDWPRCFPWRENIEDALLPYDLHVIQPDGSHNCCLECVSKKQTRKNGVCEQVFVLKDPEYDLTVEEHVAGYVDSDVFKVWTVMKNTGKKPLTLVNRNSASLGLRMEKDTYVTTFHGSWGNEMGICEESHLPIGTLCESNTLVSHNSQTIYPGCFISFGAPAQENTGTVFGAALGWDGNWQYQVSRDSADHIYFAAGAYPTPRQLAAGESYTAPFVLLSISDQGKGQVSRNFQRYMRKYGIGKGDVTRPVILNSWEGLVFDFNEEKICSLIKDAAALGAEMFVLDDGWFGNGEFARDDERRGLGDWQTNRQKLPHGLDCLAKECKKQGLKFGLWFEPEMINTNSALYKKHPNWVIAQPHRKPICGRGETQLMLDLSRPEVEEFVYHAVADVLKKYPQIAYVKWDHNMRGPNQGAAHLKDRQGAFSDLHNQACQRVAARLDRNFPNVIFQLCASGGGRADVGMMEYFDEFWASDNTTAVDRLKIQWGFSHFYPAMAMASHISRHGLDTSYKFRADVAMTARLGVELCPANITAANRALIAKGIAAYKELRPIIHGGEMFRGRSPHTSTQTEITFVKENKKTAVLFAFDVSGKGKAAKIKALGLQPEYKYKVTEMNPDKNKRFAKCVMSGADLMKKGLPVQFTKECGSSVVAKLECV